MLVAEQSGVVRILLVESHSMFRQVIARHMSECEDMQVVAHTDTISDARQTIENTSVDLVISDIALADGHVFEWITELASTRPETKFIVLSADENVDSFIRAVSLGVNAFVVKCSSYDYLLDCVRAVMTGKYVFAESVCTNAVRKLLVNHGQHKGATVGSEEAHLSARENQVLELISKGLSNKEIASELTVSISTVKTHVSRIFKRLGVTSRRQLIPRLYRLSDSNLTAGDRF